MKNNKRHFSFNNIVKFLNEKLSKYSIPGAESESYRK